MNNSEKSESNPSIHSQTDFTSHDQPQKKNVTQIFPPLLLWGVILVGVFFGGYYLGTQKKEMVKIPATQQISLSDKSLERSPSPSPKEMTLDEITAGWKTYKNTKVGIEFKYPSDWIVSENFTINGFDILHGILTLAPKTSNKPNVIAQPLTLSYWDNPKKLSLSQFEQEHPLERGGSILQIDLSKSSKVTGYDPRDISAYEPDGMCEPVLCNIYVTPHGDKIFTFTSLFTEFNERQHEIFSNIFLTMKFLDK